MGNSNRRAGTIFFKIDGTQYSAKGSYTYNLGKKKREAMIGADGIHGYKEVPKPPFIEGIITDSPDISLGELQELDGVNVTLELTNGKQILIRDGWYAHDGDASTEDAEIPVRFESKEEAEEIK